MKNLFVILMLLCSQCFGLVQLVDLLAEGAVDASGDPLSSGTVYFYDAGTTDAKTCYSDFTQSTALSTSETLDAAGKLTAYCDERTKIVIKDSDGATINTIDNIGMSDQDASDAVSTIIAGNGLGTADDGSLKINADTSTVEISSDTVQINLDGILAFSADYINNMGLAAATTTNSADSIKITGADAALSSSNQIVVTLQNSGTAGKLTTLTASADVTIDLTGAHWGLGTLGDFSDVELRVYAINDDGTLKWGVSLGSITQIVNTSSSTTTTDINTQGEMLVNSALSEGTWPCKQVGWFKANFDDAGGAAADLWAVQTSIGDLNVKRPIKDRTDWEGYTPTITAGGTTSSNAGYWRRVGDSMEIQITTAFTDAGSGADLAYDIPSGYLIDVNKVSNDGSTYLGGASWSDSGSGWRILYSNYSDTNTVKLIVDSAGSQFQGDALANGDVLSLRITVPIVQWVSN